jgi:hypothetical protein
MLEIKITEVEELSRVYSGVPRGGAGGAAAPGAGERGRQNGHQSTGARERFFQ